MLQVVKSQPAKSPSLENSSFPQYLCQKASLFTEKGARLPDLLHFMESPLGVWMLQQKTMNIHAVVTKLGYFRIPCYPRKTSFEPAGFCCSSLQRTGRSPQRGSCCSVGGKQPLSFIRGHPRSALGAQSLVNCSTVHTARLQVGGWRG